MKNSRQDKQSEAYVRKSPPLNVLSGTEDIVNRWLSFGNKNTQYRHKAACQELSRGGHCGDALTLIEDLYNEIDGNWTKWKRIKSPSDKNWKLRHAENLAEHNSSKEKRLEKNIATLLGEDWFNQIPTASGLTSSGALKKASIDLIHRTRPACYELIELKCETNSPLYAAIEILLYGLLYIHARAHQEEMQYSLPAHPLLTADEIGLRVLAPKLYYRDCELGWFEKKLSDGIAEFVGSQFTIDFKFMAFSASFRWAGNCDEEKLQAALDSVMPAFC
jgi:hypothetical protein